MVRLAAGAVVMMCIAVGCAPAAGADPFDGSPAVDSAEVVIDDLTAQGYTVQINWVSGVSSRPLGECAVLGVHNPDHSSGPPATFTTVYVDVSCPNHDDAVSGGIGVAIG